MFLRAALWGFVFGGILVALVTGIARKIWERKSGQLQCPRCHSQPAVIRMQRSLREFMWGGWTCSTCGAKVDKRGRELRSPEDPNQSARTNDG
jgi:ribosomal protein L37AE/L43A